MPVTPFHLGPAVIVKALARSDFSLGVFTLVQGVIDIESVTNILRGNSPIHAHLHTLPGSLAVGAACVLVGRPLCSRLNLVLSRRAKDLDIPQWVARELREVTWTAAITGALFGALSHVALDGMMHPDAQPLWPWFSRNPLLLDVTGAFELIHLGCAVSFLIGFRLWKIRDARR